MCSNEDSFDYQILNLTDKFYTDYPNPPYKDNELGLTTNEKDATNQVTKPLYPTTGSDTILENTINDTQGKQ